MMFAKGLLFGLILSLVNFYLLYKFTKRFISAGNSKPGLSFFLNSLIRYSLIIVLIIFFIRSGFGDILGLLVGLMLGLVVFVFIGNRNARIG